MDCATNKRLMNEKLDESISSADARSLEEHLSSCALCRRDWATLVAVDRVLADAPLDRAPVGFERSVISEITRRVEFRRRVDSVVIPAACGAAAIGVAYGVHRVVNWEAARSFVRGIGEATNGVLAPLAEPLAEAPDFVATLSQDPSAVGVMLALAVAAVVFLGVSALRIVRQSTPEWH